VPPEPLYNTHTHSHTHTPTHNHTQTQNKQLLDDQIVKTPAMRASPYIGPFEERVCAWEAKLNHTQVCVCVCVCVASRWQNEGRLSAGRPLDGLASTPLAPATPQDTLDEWLACQQSWLYLEPIFGSEDLQQQMPNEGRKFKAVDATWRRLMERLAKQPEVNVGATAGRVVGRGEEGTWDRIAGPVAWARPERCSRAGEA
jgi:hypothetical protein